MNRVRMASAVALAIAVAGVTHAADPAPTSGPGWTGVTKPMEVITARQEIM